MQITITEEHLDKAIKLTFLNRFDICQTCVVSLAIKEAMNIEEKLTTASGLVFFKRGIEEEKIGTFPKEIQDNIMDVFDRQNFDEVRKQLPVTFELSFIEKKENVNN